MKHCLFLSIAIIVSVLFISCDKERSESGELPSMEQARRLAKPYMALVDSAYVYQLTTDQAEAMGISHADFAELQADIARFNNSIERARQEKRKNPNNVSITLVDPKAPKQNIIPQRSTPSPESVGERVEYVNVTATSLDLSFSGSGNRSTFNFSGVELAYRDFTVSCTSGEVYPPELQQYDAHVVYSDGNYFSGYGFTNDRWCTIVIPVAQPSGHVYNAVAGCFKTQNGAVVATFSYTKVIRTPDYSIL